MGLQHVAELVVVVLDQLVVVLLVADCFLELEDASIQDFVGVSISLPLFQLVLAYHVEHDVALRESVGDLAA